MYWILSLRTKFNITMPLCTLTKFWQSQLMLMVHISAHKSWYFFVSVIPRNKNENYLWLLLNHRFSLMSHTLRRTLLFTFSCFYYCVRVQYVRSTFRYRTVYSSRTELTLRLLLLLLDVCSPSLFIVHEYWRNSTSYVASCHPLYLAYHTSRDRR